MAMYADRMREANQQFSRLVKTVKGGREVWLTKRGRPLAVLRPIRSGDKAVLTFQTASGLNIPFITADARQRKAAEALVMNLIWVE